MNYYCRVEINKLEERNSFKNPCSFMQLIVWNSILNREFSLQRDISKGYCLLTGRKKHTHIMPNKTVYRLFPEK